MPFFMNAKKMRTTKSADRAILFEKVHDLMDSFRS